jgi:hypothetical protein
MKLVFVMKSRPTMSGAIFAIFSCSAATTVIVGIVDAASAGRSCLGVFP